MIFGHFVVPVNESNSYIVGCEATRQAMLIDVAEWDPRFNTFLEENKLTLTTVFITHDHFDHTGGLQKTLKQYDVDVYSGRGTAGGCSTLCAQHRDSFSVGKMRFTVLSTPGHTPDSISLAMKGVVFTGDALFAGSVGGTHGPENASQQKSAIQENIFPLPDATIVCPGHGPMSTVAVERGYNPFFN